MCIEHFIEVGGKGGRETKRKLTVSKGMERLGKRRKEKNKTKGGGRGVGKNMRTEAKREERRGGRRIKRD